MRTTLRRIIGLAALGIAAGLVATTTSMAAPYDRGSPAGPRHGPGLIDVTHQLSALQRQMTKLAGRDGVAKDGTLSSLADCGYGPTAQTFLPWGDEAMYSLAPQGDLSSTSDWTLKHADVDPAHDPYSGAAASIVLNGHGSQAITPVMCVNLQNPTFRFFLSGTGRLDKSTLGVSVDYEGLDGNAHQLQLADVTAGSDWQPSLTIPIGVNLLSAASANGWTAVQFAFTANGLHRGESYSLDGIFVDPYWSR